MKWILMFLCLFGCQQDEIIFHTVRKNVKVESSDPNVQIVQTVECLEKCIPPTKCNRINGKCEGKAKDKTSPIKLFESDTELVFDNSTGRLYR